MKTLTLHKVYYTILSLQPQRQGCQGALGVKTIEFFSRRIYMKITKIEFSSQRKEILLFLTTNMAAMTSRSNQQYEG